MQLAFRIVIDHDTSDGILDIIGIVHISAASIRKTGLEEAGSLGIALLPEGQKSEETISISLPIRLNTTLFTEEL